MGYRVERMEVGGATSHEGPVDFARAAAPPPTGNEADV
jgi:hypothetical protein